MGLLDFDPDIQAAMREFQKPSPEVAAQAKNNALLSAGLSMMMNNGRGASSGQSFMQALGAGGLSGMEAYQGTITQAQKQQTNALQQAIDVTKLTRDMETMRQRNAALSGLPQDERQMLALGVSADKMLEQRQTQQYLAGRPMASETPVQLPQLGGMDASGQYQAQGTGPYRLNVSTLEQQQNIQRQVQQLRVKGDHQSADQIVAALVKQGAIAPPTQQVVPNAQDMAQYSVRGQLAGIKGASADYNYAKDFLKPDWQQIDNGGQIQFVNKNSGAMPTIAKTDTPEIQWQREKWGHEQSHGSRNQGISREAELRKEFANLQTSQDWWSAQPVLQTAREASKINDKTADLNLIYAVAKLYDPGSVVREGETSMQIKSGSPAEQFQGLFNQVVGGGALTPSLRTKIMAQVESRARGYEDAYKARAEQYRTIANRYGIDHENIITNGSITAARKEESQQPSDSYSVTAPNGKTYYFPDAKSMANFKLKTGVK